MPVPGLQNISLDELFSENGITLSVLRLDKIHPVVSGNKLFKLHYFLADAAASAHKTILSFGGAYSNHLAATAFACHAAGLHSIGVIRGEKPSQLSPTLQHCLEYGMQLKFISREEYRQKEESGQMAALRRIYGDCIIIPEGGFHPLGAKGAELIMGLLKEKHFSTISVLSGSSICVRTSNAKSLSSA